jgi:hypothetical protein
LDPEYCARIARDVIGEYDSITASGWKFCAGGRYTGHLNFNPGQYGPEFFDALKRGGHIAAAEELLGSRLDIFLMSGNMNLGGSRPQDMHQDFAPPSEALVFNVTLVPTRAETGATQIIPGSQGARYTYRTLHSSGAIRTARQIESEPGDLVMRLASLWHRGMPNRTAAPRPMLAIGMVPTDKAAPTIPPHDRISFYANRFYGKHARFRELAEIHLAPAFHYYRMAKS